MKVTIRLAAAAAVLILLSAALFDSAQAVPAGDVAVTDQVYVRHDGGSDITIESCADDSPEAGGNRQQNEPSVAINPSNTDIITAGSNDYCSGPTTGDGWLGFYVSTDNGASWVDSLNPGYPTDTSSEGMASPIYGRAVAAGDPIMDWDNENRLFYGGISFNRSNPTNGDVSVSTWVYDASASLSMDFLRTVIVGKGTPSVAGRFNDKPSLRVDDWVGSPYEGNVYVSWTLYPGNAGNPQVLFSHSSDHGLSFSKPIKISMGFTVAQGSDIAVGPDGTVYVMWRRFGFVGPNAGDAIVIVKSSDGGQTFSNPQDIRLILPYDRNDQYVTGGYARDCGDGPDLCVTNFVFHRLATFPSAVVDASGTVYAAWEEVIPGDDNGDTYHPDGQAQVMVTRSSDMGATWADPVAIDPQPAGHQWWPNLEYDRQTGTLAAIYYDSRSDPYYSPNLPPGNQPDGTSSCGVPAPQACDVLNTYLATSSDGVNWFSILASTIGHQPEYEMFDARQVPFHGDYLWVDANGGTVFGVWADNRDVVPGEDLRETEQDGFDVLQCLELQPDGSYSSTTTCPNTGGLNQNIYGGGLLLP